MAAGDAHRSMRLSAITALNTWGRMALVVALFTAAIAGGISTAHFLGRGHDGISEAQAIAIAQREIQGHDAEATVIAARADRFDRFWYHGETEFAVPPAQRVWAVAFRGTFSGSCGPVPPAGEQAHCALPNTTMMVILNYRDGGLIEEASPISGFENPTPISTGTASALRSTGIASVDAVIDALLARDVDQLVNDVRFGRMACVAQPSEANFGPQCPQGTAEGTPLPTFLFGFCSSGVVTTTDEVRQSFKTAFSASAPSVYAVFKAGTAANVPNARNPGYSIVLDPGTPPSATANATAWILDLDGHIVELDFGCGPMPPAKLVQLQYSGYEFLLPPLAPTASPISTPVQFPVAPADHDAPVWAYVRQWQGANISPILRPTFLPPGLDTVTIGQPPNKPDVDLLSVEYSGPGKTLRIAAGGLNPGPGDYQRAVTFRGQDAALATTRVEGSSGSVWWISLWWREPGLRAGQIGNPIYAVSAAGLTEQEVLRVAESLIPIGP